MSSMTPCASCGFANPPGARFCGACRAQSAASAHVRVEEPPICSGCGVLVDASRAACVTCGATYPRPPVSALPQPSGGYWVAVRATFTCNACRFDVPLNHFELGDGVVCTRCGLEQRHDQREWKALVEFAHAVGDLGMPGPDGRFGDPARPLHGNKPFALLGTSESWAASQAFRASPGNPLCRTCKAPRVVVARSGARLDVACSRCGERHAYELPAKERQLPDLAGVLADEHEADRPEIAMRREGDVVVLRCPNCAAPLSGIKDEDGTVQCSYCEASCRISTDTHARIGHRETPIKTWWLYFEEPSRRRRDLYLAAAAAVEKQRNRAAEEAARERDRRRLREESAERDAEIEAKAQAAERRAVIPLVATMTFGALVGGVIFLRNLKKKAVADVRPASSVIAKYSFSMTPKEASNLFGADVRPFVAVKLREPGVFKEVHFGGGGGGGPTYAIDLFGGADFDAKRARTRLAGLVPNRLRASPDGRMEVSVGRALLRIDPRPTPQYSGRVEVMTWIPGEAGVAAADAFLAAALYATLDAPKPPAEQLRAMNGPTLADAAKLAPETPTESATKAFLSVFPGSECKTQTDLPRHETMLSCVADLDHPLFAKIRMAWSNVPKGHLQLVYLEAVPLEPGKNATIPTGCVERALGKGKEVVVDFASGEKELQWSFGSQGDHAVHAGFSLTFQTDKSAAPEHLPEWSKVYAKTIAALVDCTR